MKNTTPNKQRGAVLIVSLIMLAVMTLFVISMLKTSVIELKIGGVSQVAAVNFANAEAGVEKYISDNDGRFAPGFLTLASGAGGPINNAMTDFVFNSGSTVAITTTQIAGCGAPPAGSDLNSGLRTMQFDVAGAASDSIMGGSTIVHQGVQTFTLLGAC